MINVHPWGARACALAAMLFTASVHAANVRVTITNQAPGGGIWLTPLWVGFHDGSFDSFDVGATASAGIEALAEAGDPGPLTSLFGGSGLSGVIGGGPLAPGASASAEFSLASGGAHDYLSFGAMVLPSSDFFIGNASPRAIALAGVLDGTFSRADVTIAAIYDAGTEVNDFATAGGNGLFGIPGGQTDPDQGVDQNGVVTLAAGTDYLAFLNLAGADVAPLNFGAYAAIATITIESVPAPVPLPASLPLLASVIVGLGWARRRGG